MRFILPLIALFFLAAFDVSAAVQKLEGSCQGRLHNGKSVSFKYYSDFNGCKQKSSSAISYSGSDTLRTGTRRFTETSDIYEFSSIKLTLANSTGNTSAYYHYKDANGGTRRVKVQCEVRDYEYGECY